MGFAQTTAAGRTSRASLAATLALGLLAAACGDTRLPASRMAELVEWLRSDPAALTALLERMPKGADLHSHLTGAARTESLIDWGIESELCVDEVGLVASSPPCGPGMIPMRDAATDPDLYLRILGAWSMDGFVGPVLARHAHFFATFAKFGAAARTADIFVEQKREAVRERLVYLEIMSSYGSSSVIPIGNDYLPVEDAWSAEYLAERRAAMLADARFPAAIESGLAFISSSFDEMDRQLGCNTPSAEPACEVELRLQVTGTRTGPRAAVFAQFLYGFEIAQRDERVVAINLVAPEEDPNSLAFYDDEMLAAGTLRTIYASTPGLRPVRLSLHAGELIPEVLPPTPEGQRQLTFHIRRAVEVGLADRIGHGVDLEHEYEGANQTPETLLATMRERGVMVEVSLTSNALLLDVEGPTHPMGAYLAHGVPVTLSTDDEGVLRTDLTEQYVRAVIDQELGYFTLKEISRNGLEYGFAPGASLWDAPGSYHRFAPACSGERPGRNDPSRQCALYLAENRRADLQWRLEAAFTLFESESGG